MFLMSFDETHLNNLNKTLNSFFDYIFALFSQKTNINFCYIGTAKKDSFFDGLFFSKFIQAKFGKNVNIIKLLLTKTKKTITQIEALLETQDIIFIGGGNTAFMLDIWESKGLTHVLNRLRAENRLPLIAGVSAGGMFPFKAGLSDYTPGYYKSLTCLGWFNNSFCPHADSKKESLCDTNKRLSRMSAYQSAINEGHLPPGYAVPNDCMLHFYDNNLVRALSSRESNDCYFVDKNSVSNIETVFLNYEHSPLTLKYKSHPKCWKKLFNLISLIHQYFHLITKVVAG